MNSLKLLFKIQITAICILIASIQSDGQSKSSLSSFQCFEENFHQYKSEQIIIKQNWNKDFGDVIFSEDFGGGTIPNGWTTYDENPQQNNYLWTWTDQGTTGQFGSDYFQSTSNSNGWMMLDSDGYGLGSYNSFLVSPEYDLSAYSSIAISWEEYYKRWGGETSIYNGNPTYLGILVNGNIACEIELHSNFSQHDQTSNSESVMFNVATYVGGESSIQFYFRMAGNWDFWWHIDDFKLIEGANNDLQLRTVLPIHVAKEGNEYVYLGYYNSIPLNQVTPLAFVGDVWNSGANVQNNLYFSTNVNNQAGIELFNQSSHYNELLPDSSKEYWINNYIIPYEVDIYETEHFIDQEEIDQVPENNTCESLQFEVNNNKVYARDCGMDLQLGVHQFTGGDNGDFIGTKYYITSPDTIESISIFLGDDTESGNVLIAQLYDPGSGTPLVQVSSEEYTIQPGDVGTWITIPFVAINPDDLVLVPGTNYIVGVECYFYSPSYIFIGADTHGPHAYSLASSLRLGSSWYYIPYVPLIHMNLSGANVQPFITSMPSVTEMYNYEAFSYDVTTYDPQGLPVSITALESDPDIQMTAIDNGNGTMSISTPILTNTSFTDEYFMITIRVDNSITQSYQDVVVRVKNPLSLSEVTPILNSIYPNPVDQFCTISLDRVYSGIEVSVFNSMGALLLSNHFDNRDEIKLNLNNLSTGVYFIQVKTDQTYSLNKIVKL